MTPKQKLLRHIHLEHKKVPAKRLTFVELGRWHARQHHRTTTNHYHAGPNTDAANRPPGWWTGADPVPIDRTPLRHHPDPEETPGG